MVLDQFLPCLRTFFQKSRCKISNMPPFDFDQLWLKSGPLAPEHVAKVIWAPTLYLRGKKKIKPKKVLISIPQRPPWTKRYQRSWFWYQKKKLNKKRYWFQYLSGSLMHFHISIRDSEHFIFKAWWALSRVTQRCFAESYCLQKQPRG